MTISKDKKLLQVVVNKNTHKLLKKYSDLFGFSVSQLCNFLISERIVEIINAETEYQNKIKGVSKIERNS